MRVLFYLTLALFSLAFLSGCQSGATSYGGDIGVNKRVAKKAPVKSARQFRNERASLVIPVEERGKQKKAVQRRVTNERTSLVIPIEERWTYKQRYGSKEKRTSVFGLTAKPKSVRKIRKSAQKSRNVFSLNRLASVKKSPRKIRKTSKRRAVSSQRKASTRRVAKRKVVRKGRKVARKSGKRSRNSYRALIAKHARANGVPVRLAMAVVQVESNYRAGARGRAGEIGLMQIMPRTARGIGYRGKMRNLYNPNTNLKYGMKYLGKAYRLGGRTACGAVLKYNAGHGAKRWNPISRKYCNRVKRIMRRS